MNPALSRSRTGSRNRSRSPGRAAGRTRSLGATVPQSPSQRIPPQESWHPSNMVSRQVRPWEHLVRFFPWQPLGFSPKMTHSPPQSLPPQSRAQVWVAVSMQVIPGGHGKSAKPPQSSGTGSAQIPGQSGGPVGGSQSSLGSSTHLYCARPPRPGNPHPQNTESHPRSGTTCPPAHPYRCGTRICPRCLGGGIHPRDYRRR